MLSEGGKYQMVSTPDYPKSKRFEQKSTVMLANEHSEYFDKEKAIKDRGGTRSAVDRRQKLSSDNSLDKRKVKDRRTGFDRRSGLGRRRDRNLERTVERRDVFRQRD
jgi:hypothetical protein